MDKEAVLRLVDSLHRDKDINKEKVFEGIEAAILSAAKKHYKSSENVTVTIDRGTGEIAINGGGDKIDPAGLGRITAQTAKQVIIQKVREAECNAVHDEFMSRRETIISGVVRGFEGPNMIVDLGKTEGILRKTAQISGEYYHVGERVRALIVDVKKFSHKVRVILSRTHPDFVKRLFELEVPEISDNVIEIKAIARESGHRTKIAVYSTDANVDCVGACVGVRGVRIKSVVDELNGEKIDIVKWSDSAEELLPNALKPAGVSGLVLSSDGRTASIIVPDDQFSLAIGKRGQNVRLASMLTEWSLDIITESQFEQSGGEDGFKLKPGAGSQSESDDGGKKGLQNESNVDLETEQPQNESELGVETATQNESEVETEQLVNESDDESETTMQNENEIEIETEQQKNEDENIVKVGNINDNSEQEKVNDTDIANNEE